jgi:hypothetical protein
MVLYIEFFVLYPTDFFSPHKGSPEPSMKTASPLMLIRFHMVRAFTPAFAPVFQQLRHGNPIKWDDCTDLRVQPRPGFAPEKKSKLSIVEHPKDATHRLPIPPENFTPGFGETSRTLSNVVRTPLPTCPPNPIQT